MSNRWSSVNFLGLPRGRLKGVGSSFIFLLHFWFNLELIDDIYAVGEPDIIFPDIMSLPVMSMEIGLSDNNAFFLCQLVDNNVAMEESFLRGMVPVGEKNKNRRENDDRAIENNFIDYLASVFHDGLILMFGGSGSSVFSGLR